MSADLKQRTALHEASHAVVADYLGVCVDGMAMGEACGRDDTAGITWLGRGYDRLTMVQKLAVLCAGRISDSRQRGTAVAWSGKMTGDKMEIFKLLGTTDFRELAAFREAEALAARILTSEAAAVRLLASALLKAEDQELDRVAIAAVFSEALAAANRSPGHRMLAALCPSAPAAPEQDESSAVADPSHNRHLAALRRRLPVLHHIHQSPAIAGIPRSFP
jgi:hypothetical protein